MLNSNSHENNNATLNTRLQLLEFQQSPVLGRLIPDPQRKAWWGIPERSR